MNRYAYILVIVAGLISAFSSCKKKEQTDDIIVDKVIEKPQEGPENMPESEQSGSVTWISGGEYSYTISRKADNALPIVTNHDKQYHDNSITLTVNRADGSQFFQKTFSKTNFAPVLPKQFKDNGVLLGMNLDKVDGNNLLFVVSVGSPDQNYEEFYCVQMTLTNLGATSASEYHGQAVEE